MRDHPIAPVTELFQYRAIGLVRGKYKPADIKGFSRGLIEDQNGLEIEAVVLGRTLSLIKRKVSIDSPHLWVVYPRCRDSEHLHLQIAGIWEPSTLDQTNDCEEVSNSNDIAIKDDDSDKVKEGDDYFSIRGELIYTKAETNNLVLKIRQRPRADGSRPLPFKLNLKGSIPLEHLRHFVSLDVRRKGNQLCLEDHEVIAPMPTRGGKRKGVKSSGSRKASSKANQRP